MKQESFCVVGVPPTWSASVPGIETLGAWTDSTGWRHVDEGRLISHSELDYDAVFDLAKSMGEQSFLSVDIHRAAHLVWTDGKKPTYLGQWQEVRADEVAGQDYTSLYDDDAGYQRFFRAGAP